MENFGDRTDDLIRDAWLDQFHITTPNMQQKLTSSLCRQLSFCKSDEARRLILGISIKGVTEYVDAPRVDVGRSALRGGVNA